MSGLTEDQIAALHEWATHHPRLEKALTAGMLADLHGVVADMLATAQPHSETGEEGWRVKSIPLTAEAQARIRRERADCSPESAQTVAREARPTPQDVVGQIADRMYVGNPDADEAAMRHGFMERLDAPTTITLINEVVCRVMIEDGPDGHTDGSEAITAAALAEVKRLLTEPSRHPEGSCPCTKTYACFVHRDF